MSFFSKYYLEMILIITVGLIFNPDNGLLKISIFFLLSFWAVFHFFIFKRLFSNSEMLKNMINEDDDQVESKLKKNLKRSYYILTLTILLISCIIKSGVLLFFGILIVVAEMVKFFKVRKEMNTIKIKEQTSSLNQEV